MNILRLRSIVLFAFLIIFVSMTPVYIIHVQAHHKPGKCLKRSSAAFLSCLAWRHYPCPPHRRL